MEAILSVGAVAPLKYTRVNPGPGRRSARSPSRIAPDHEGGGLTVPGEIGVQENRVARSAGARPGPDRDRTAGVGLVAIQGRGDRPAIDAQQAGDQFDRPAARRRCCPSSPSSAVTGGRARLRRRGGRPAPRPGRATIVAAPWALTCPTCRGVEPASRECRSGWRSRCRPLRGRGRRRAGVAARAEAQDLAVDPGPAPRACSRSSRIRMPAPSPGTQPIAAQVERSAGPGGSPCQRDI